MICGTWNIIAYWARPRRGLHGLCAYALLTAWSLMFDGLYTRASQTRVHSDTGTNTPSTLCRQRTNTQCTQTQTHTDTHRHTHTHTYTHIHTHISFSTHSILRHRRRIRLPFRHIYLICFFLVFSLFLLLVFLVFLWFFCGFFWGIFFFIQTYIQFHKSCSGKQKPIYNEKTNYRNEINNITKMK